MSKSMQSPSPPALAKIADALWLVLVMLGAAAGLCGLVASFADLLPPALAARLIHLPAPGGLVGLATALWLVVLGLNLRQSRLGQPPRRPSAADPLIRTAAGRTL